MDRAALLTRTDRKYVVPDAAVTGLVRALASLPGGARVLDIDGRRSFGYRSVYLDTPALQCYREAAHRRPLRCKVRTRSYVDSGGEWLEVKTRDRRGRTTKHRVPRDGSSADDRALSVPERAFVAQVLEDHGLGLPTDQLRPALVTSYRRTTVWLPGDDVRVTVDTELVCRSLGAGVALARRAVVETKSPGAPSAADHVLWRAGHRPARVSKYATGMAALDPALPATPWRPVLSRHPFVCTTVTEPSRRTS
ncbi:polyphosphate polymerase domain-containing protein [Cellulomonas sp. APG4]|nr:polyphosphate polymerase domain-containing protein [Cellulomonas sp. APG4]NCT90783.1 polyphosphate polymerase domain-containing protein [Cellulomonas sp. APG4]